jgi:hypothetical protein
VVLAADVLEHISRPKRFLRQMRQVVSPEGSVIVCVPNVSHWYPRARTMLGLFDYDQRGILDVTHLRFFTRRSIRRMLERCGFSIVRFEAVGLPLDALGLEGTKAKTLRLVDHLLVTLWPTMFGYQFIVEVKPTPGWRDPVAG